MRTSRREEGAEREIETFSTTTKGLLLAKGSAKKKEAQLADDVLTLVDHAMKAAGATTRVLSDQALELLWRATSLAIAHHREQSFVDDAS